MIHRHLISLLICVTGLTAGAQSAAQCGCNCTCDACQCSHQDGGKAASTGSAVKATVMPKPRAASAPKKDGQKYSTDNPYGTRTTVRTRPAQPSDEAQEEYRKKEAKHSKVEKTVRPDKTDKKGKDDKKDKNKKHDKDERVSARSNAPSQHAASTDTIWRIFDESELAKYGVNENSEMYKTRARYVWKDDSIPETEEELLPYITTVGRQVMPKRASMNDGQEDVFLYYEEHLDGTPRQLHLRVQHCAADSLPFDAIEFQVDQWPESPDDRMFTYSLTPQNTEIGHSNGNYWSHCDNELRGSDDRDLVYALAHCYDWAQMTLFVSTDDSITPYTHTLTDDQLRDILIMLQFFRLRGGTIN